MAGVRHEGLVYQTMCCRGAYRGVISQSHGPCDDDSLCRFNIRGNLGFGRQRPKGSLLEPVGVDGGVADMELINGKRTWQDICGLLGICKGTEARKETYRIAEYLPVNVEGRFGRSGQRTYGLYSVNLRFSRGCRAD